LNQAELVDEIGVKLVEGGINQLVLENKTNLGL
jgi:hypothetical protein